MASGGNSSRKAPRAVLEWVAAAAGLLIAGLMIGFIGYEALRGSGKAPPALSVTAREITGTAGGYVVSVVVRNGSDQTAAAVTIEGELKDGGRSLEASQATLSYVPGRSERSGGLVFTRDPRRLKLMVRVTGYAIP